MAAAQMESLNSLYEEYYATRNATRGSVEKQ
jgi:hypothetical protein